MATRVVRLDLTLPGTEGRRALGVRVFHKDTIYWVRTRSVSGVSLKGLLEHLIDEISAREIAKLPFNLFQYSIYDLSREIPLMPALTVDDVAGPILYIHESEFLTAFDKQRRIELVAHMVKHVEKQLPAELVSQEAPAELQSVARRHPGNSPGEIEVAKEIEIVKGGEEVKNVKDVVESGKGAEVAHKSVVRPMKPQEESVGWAYWRRMVG